jgi:hypothetical protein
MKIDIPKVIVTVNMVEYAPELDGKFLHVWVNPSKQKLQEYTDLVTGLQSKELEAARQTLFPDLDGKAKGNGAMKESSGILKAFDVLGHWLSTKKEQKTDGVDARLLEWYAEIWSQGPADARWAADELQELEMQDPTFLSWMIAETWKARAEHIERKKKA